jgi:hypothetical protein
MVFSAELAGAVELLLDWARQWRLFELTPEGENSPQVVAAKAILAEYYAGAPAEPLTCSLDALSSELSALAAKLQQAEEGN